MGVDDMMRWVTQLSLTALKTEFVCKFAGKKREFKTSWHHLDVEKVTLEFQIDHTVGKNLHGWKNSVENGARATEMCPDIKAIGIWLSAIENL